MKLIIGIFFLINTFAMTSIMGQGKKTENDVKTVDHVDLKKYVGLWYEIAKIPNSFQKKCKYGTTAFYKLRNDGDIDVTNSCYDESDERTEVNGLAKVVDKKTNAKLEVSFVRIFGIYIFWGDYWIIGLGKDYEYAVVGTPNKKYGWILSRTPHLSKDKLDEAFRILTNNGYDINNFEMTIQNK